MKLKRNFHCGYLWLSMWVNVKVPDIIKLVTKKVAALSRWVW